MKRYIFILSGVLFSFGVTFAQDETDALRYSQTYINGTARSTGLGGAIGAVGGDFSSLGVNPAGLGIYRQSEFSFSPSIYWNNTDASYLGNSYNDERYNFNFGSLGFVMNNKLRNGSGLVSTNFAFGYNRLNNFGGSVFMGGINDNSSLLDNFTDNINANPNDLNQYYEQIAYDANLIPEDIDEPGLYFNDIQNGGYGQLQRRSIDTKGSIGEYLFAFGANMEDRLYFGASIGINRVFFEQDVRHTESDANNQIPVFNRFVYTEYLKTRGTGFNAKVGIIARPVDALRVGAAYHIPTFYSLNDVYTTDVESYFDPGYDYNESASSPFGEYDYDLRTPGKFVGSMTLTFGQIAMISADYEYIDYTKSRLDAPDYDFYDENQEIQDGYQATHNIRVGGELKFGLAYLRGGYAFYQSPYNFAAPVNPNRNVISGGAGLRTKSFFFDLAFAHANQESLYYMYVPMDNGASLDSKMNTMVMTLGFRF